MSKLSKFLLMAIVSVAMAGVFSCKEETPPAPQPQVVKQKIATQRTNPAQTQPAAPSMADATQPVSTPAQAGMPQSETNDTSSDAGGNQPVSDLIKESVAIAVGYDPQGRFDPFEPLFKDEDTAQSAAVSKDKRKKRTPQTPLERVAISQLKLSAIMRTAKGNSAIVEDASGKGYVIRKGTYIGLNSGQVVKIDKDHVEIEEETENVMGELVIQNTELKLQKPAGEL
jgi:type IV pilus assembly protein PilP